MNEVLKRRFKSKENLFYRPDPKTYRPSVVLGPLLGRGGFSGVYEMANCPALVVKIAEYQIDFNNKQKAIFVNEIEKEIKRMAEKLKDPNYLSKTAFEVFSSHWMTVSSGNIASN